MKERPPRAGFSKDPLRTGAGKRIQAGETKAHFVTKSEALVTPQSRGKAQGVGVTEAP